MWNSRSQTIIDLAINAKDQASFRDVYQLFHEDQKVDKFLTYCSCTYDTKTA